MLEIVGFSALLASFIVGLWLYSLKTDSAFEEFVIAASVLFSALILLSFLPFVFRIIFALVCLSAVFVKRNTKHVIALGAISAAAMLSVLTWIYFRV